MPTVGKEIQVGTARMHQNKEDIIIPITITEWLGEPINANYRIQIEIKVSAGQTLAEALSGDDIAQDIEKAIANRAACVAIDAQAADIEAAVRAIVEI